MEVVTLGRGVGLTTFWEHAALMMLGSKVCRITGVVMIFNPVVMLLIADIVLMLAVAFKLATAFRLVVALKLAVALLLTCVA